MARMVFVNLHHYEPIIATPNGCGIWVPKYKCVEGSWFLPFEANGLLIRVEEKDIIEENILCKFEDPKWLFFHGYRK